LPGPNTAAASDKGGPTFSGLVLKRRGWQTTTAFDAGNDTTQGTIGIDVP
jgi:hypothetical protein